MHKAVCCFVCKLSPSYMYFYPSVITGQRKPGAILTSTPGVASDFSLTVNFQCRLSFLFSLFFFHYNKYNTCQYTCSNSFMVFVQLPRASISTCTLNIQSAGSHTIIWIHKNTAHTGENGYHCSCGCSTLTKVNNLNLLQGINEVLKQTSLAKEIRTLL